MARTRQEALEGERHEGGGHIVYYVFFRLFEEAKTERGKELAKEQWEKIRPELVKLMGLKPGEDPINVLGVPKIFK